MTKRALQSFVVGQRLVHAGDILADDDPILKGRAGLVEDLDEFVSRSRARVEQATAAPGEMRSLTKPKAEKKTSKKADTKADAKVKPKDEPKPDAIGDAKTEPKTDAGDKGTDEKKAQDKK